MYYLCTALREKALLEKEVQKMFWRGGRVVDCGGLENRCAARHPGFESLSLRKLLKINKLSLVNRWVYEAFLFFYRRLADMYLYID